MMKLLHGDCLDQLKTLADNSVDAIVTDPPYGLSFMGKRWDYDVPSVDVWTECLRVLKPGGHLLAFAGTRTQHRMAVRIEDAGFEIRDMIAWVYGSGFPKSHNLKDEWQGWGTALKPALEPITVARKPLTGTVAANVLAWGTGGLNIDGCRVEADWNADPNKRGWQGSKGDFSGWQYHGTKDEKKEIPTQGRWPANLIHDGSEEVTGLFPHTKSGGFSEGTVQQATNGNSKGRENARVRDARAPDTGSAARFFYCAKASKRDRDEGLDGFAKKTNEDWPQSMDGNDKRGAEPRANVHPTVKPTDLMRYLCRLVTPPGGVVLDPFMGSGSTGKAAALEGFDFIGIEREAEYLAIADARIKFVQPQADNDNNEQMSLAV